MKKYILLGAFVCSMLATTQVQANFLSQCLVRGAKVVCKIKKSVIAEGADGKLIARVIDETVEIMIEASERIRTRS